MTTPLPAPKIKLIEAFATFSGQINEDSTKRIFTALAQATQNNVTHVHLLLESYGGFVGDGIALHNVFKSSPLELTLYNAGSVQSIAAIAFLGAKVRKVSARGAFMLHSAAMGQTVTSAAVLEAVSKCIAVDNARIRAILREHVRLTVEQWQALDYMDLHFSAEESVANGIAQEIGEFLPPKGSKLYSI